MQSGLQKLRIMKPNKHRFRILDDISGALRPGRITLLLGPPGAGKSTLLNALAGRLQKSILMVCPGLLCQLSTALVLVHMYLLTPSGRLQSASCQYGYKLR